MIAPINASRYAIRRSRAPNSETFVNKVLDLEIDDGSDEGPAGMRHDAIIRECGADSTSDNGSYRTPFRASVGPVRDLGLQRHKKGA